MTRKELLYEGKAKRVYATDDPTRCIIEFKDDATAFNGVKKGTIADKGVMNNEMSSYLFAMLATAGVGNHFIQRLSDREMLVRRVQIIPLEVIVRNIVAGSMSKRLGIAEGARLATPVIEFSYKNDQLGDPLVNEDHIRALGAATDVEVTTLRRLALEVNRLLQKRFAAADITLVDFKLEFGRADGAILLADEISPDTCRFWDSATGKKLDKDRFRRDLGGVEEGYHEVLGRLLTGRAQ
ncbi:phosphoribosylaminoimidazolesuccinocarboxamide synthase [Candidatus Cryosericum odellii]|jgi:phosphoribosylaminoimidazole-succinocarboxamide synthase|uniref:Phosphoribosylaminoimidazole-succinocarboxamide synthase n=1 Tax=Candidatus Cryosericum odellii TaxID=2290917 RepID=A0A398DFF4_9BACT|nr:phosphoribosylaminoimidazolesuccinocarboxamide synthase [Candidatus Cryosericum odellii]RIE09814.1 phosphoribosylaminoimidazolesuccinocarboxamide synthase [Candidatus Cryosericum odellii]